jgi:hypothetical protein
MYNLLLGYYHYQREFYYLINEQENQHHACNYYFSRDFPINNTAYKSPLFYDAKFYPALAVGFARIRTYLAFTVLLQ